MAAVQKTYAFRPLEHWPQYREELRPSHRWGALDLARGFAIVLMILSHCVKGLLAHSMLPDWGVIPMHLMTKFSSSLFILVFGISVSLYFVPHVGKKTWPKKRWWMIKRGLELMLWYKLLTVIQMFQFYSEAMIIDTLLFQRMPDFVEILCFYSIALMWIPFVLPFWTRRHPLVKAGFIFAIVAAGQWLHHNFSFWDIAPLKAILVEQDGYYTFGQFQRGALVFLGVFLGDMSKKLKTANFQTTAFPIICMGLGLASLTFFAIVNAEHLMESLNAIARNQGKHPMGLNFMTFSLGGALLLLGVCLFGRLHGKVLLEPLRYIGRNSLKAFVLHIIIIFYVFRYRMDLHHSVSYTESLALTLACIGLVMLAANIWNRLQKAISLRNSTFVFFSLGLLQTSCVSSDSPNPRAPWIQQMKVQTQLLNKNFTGEFGVFIKDLHTGTVFSHNSNQYWYLSSTVKIPVAITLLKLVDQNKIELAEKVTITKADYRDGAGSVNWIKPGKAVTYRYLLDQMLIHSDNAATDLIIRRIGMDSVNAMVSSSLGHKKFGPITTLLDVRKKAYSEFHPEAARLTNMDFFAIKKQRVPAKKLNHLAQLLKVSRKRLKYQNLSDGFEAYYRKNWNSAPLTSYAQLLEKLSKNKLLSQRSTQVLLGILSKIQTGNQRIKKGLPRNYPWAHKTGTQHKQACDVGIAGKTQNKRILILVCVKNWETLSQAEKLVSKVSAALTRTNLF